MFKSFVKMLMILRPFCMLLGAFWSFWTPILVIWTFLMGLWCLSWILQGTRLDLGRFPRRKTSPILRHFGTKFSIRGSRSEKKQLLKGVWKKVHKNVDFRVPGHSKNCDFRCKGLQKSMYGLAHVLGRFGVILASFWGHKSQLYSLWGPARQ